MSEGKEFDIDMMVAQAIEDMLNFPDIALEDLMKQYLIAAVEVGREVQRREEKL